MLHSSTKKVVWINTKTECLQCKCCQVPNFCALNLNIDQPCHRLMITLQYSVHPNLSVRENISSVYPAVPNQGWMPQDDPAIQSCTLAHTLPLPCMLDQTPLQANHNTHCYCFSLVSIVQCVNQWLVCHSESNPEYNAKCKIGHSHHKQCFKHAVLNTIIFMSPAASK